MKRLLSIIIITLGLTGCQNLTPEERAAILQFSLKAGDAVLVKATSK